MTSGSDTSGGQQRRPFFPREVMASVARAAHITYDDLIGKNRSRSFVRARAVASKVMNERGVSMASIGRMMGGRDHTTIGNLLHNYDARYGADPIAQRVLAATLREWGDSTIRVVQPEPEPEVLPEPTLVTPKKVAEKRYYDFVSMRVGEVRAYKVSEPIEAERVRKAAHNRNAMTDFYFRTRTKDGHVHVIRIR